MRTYFPDCKAETGLRWANVPLIDANPTPSLARPLSHGAGQGASDLPPHFFQSDALTDETPGWGQTTTAPATCPSSIHTSIDRSMSPLANDPIGHHNATMAHPVVRGPSPKNALSPLPGRRRNNGSQQQANESDLPSDSKLNIGSTHTRRARYASGACVLVWWRHSGTLRARSCGVPGCDWV